MGTTILLGILGAAILAIVGLFMIRMFRLSKGINLTETPEGEKPEWLSSEPPPETVVETKKDGEKSPCTILTLGKTSRPPSPSKSRISSTH